MSIMLRLPLLIFAAVAAAADPAVTLTILPPPQAATRPPLTITAEIADTPAQRRRGLSGRETLADDQGMLFRYEKPRQGVCMWMKDTLIPLAALFITEDSRIHKIAFMQPHTRTTHCSEAGVFIKDVLEITAAAGRTVHRDSRIRLE